MENNVIEKIVYSITEMLKWDDIDDQTRDITKHLIDIQLSFQKQDAIIDFYIQKCDDNNFDLYLFTKKFLIKKGNLSNTDENNYTISQLKDSVKSVSVTNNVKQRKLIIKCSLKENCSFNLSSEGRTTTKLNNILQDQLIPNICV